MRPRATVPLERCRIGTPDGDFLDLDYAPEFEPDAPVDVRFVFNRAETARAILLDDADPMAAFMAGRFRSDGHLPLAFVLLGLFRADYGVAPPD